jgi:GT2 family glycosyltransferase
VLRDPADYELVVIDQSTNDDSVKALRALPPDPRLRVVRSPLRGLSVARNTGVAESSAPVVLFTDDDCRPAANWVSSMAKVFRDDPEAALVFGRVRLPEGADGSGYAASFEPGERVLEQGIPVPSVPLGVGANFGIRREVHHALGGFDPLMGPGTPMFYAGGEETDLLIRALHDGYRIVNAPESDVLHLGVRVGKAIRTLAVGYQLGTGAAFGKLVRLRGVSGFKEFARRAAYYGQDIVRDVTRLRRPRPGVLTYFIAGAAMTFRYGIDKDQSRLTIRGVRD